MKKKGWSKAELDYAHETMSKAQKTRSHRTLDSIIMWLLFLIMVIGNIAAIALIMPLMTLFSNTVMIIILLLLGLCFGFLYDVILHDIQHLFKGHHHFFVMILIPYLSIMGGFIILNIAKAQLPNLLFIERDPLKLSLFYVVAFMIPFAISKFIETKHKMTTK